MGTPPPKTGRNSDVRRHLRETVDDDRAWEQELEQSSEPTQEQKSSSSAAIRGRAQRYY